MPTIYCLKLPSNHFLITIWRNLPLSKHTMWAHRQERSLTLSSLQRKQHNISFMHIFLFLSFFAHPRSQCLNMKSRLQAVYQNGVSTGHESILGKLANGGIRLQIEKSGYLLWDYVLHRHFLLCIGCRWFAGIVWAGPRSHFCIRSLVERSFSCLSGAGALSLVRLLLVRWTRRDHLLMWTFSLSFLM